MYSVPMPNLVLVLENAQFVQEDLPADINVCEEDREVRPNCLKKKNGDHNSCNPPPSFD